MSLSHEFCAGIRVAIARAAVAPLAATFSGAGYRLYLVGGLIRDDLLGRVRDDVDYDLTTDARPETIKTLVDPFADAVWTAGERFGTIACRIDGAVYEITTHRADAYDESSRKPIVEFGDNVHDDLARRDFTVNAMAIDLADGALVDPFGGGADLEAGRLRTPLDPEISFSDDPLRMLRAARFIATLGLAPEPASSRGGCHARTHGDRVGRACARRTAEDVVAAGPSSGLPVPVVNRPAG